MDLPLQIRAALETHLHGVSRRELAQRAARLSETYRASRGTALAIGTPHDALAYAVARMPATYAATAIALRRMAERMPDFAPSSVLDIGGGPGTASFAAVDLWPQIAQVTLVERNAPFRALAKSLLEASESPALRAATLLCDDVASTRQNWPRADLVIAGYVGIELPEAAARDMAADAFAKSNQALLLVEPGTPAGFARIRAARDELIGLGASPVAPCPHAIACPIVAPDWCHFSVRLSRSRDHRLLKAADAPFEDEPFSYLAVRRGTPAPEPAARILAPPRISKAGMELRLCTRSGLAERQISRRDKAEWSAARRLGWGDLLPDNHACVPQQP